MVTPKPFVKLQRGRPEKRATVGPSLKKLMAKCNKLPNSMPCWLRRFLTAYTREIRLAKSTTWLRIDTQVGRVIRHVTSFFARPMNGPDTTCLHMFACNTLMGSVPVYHWLLSDSQGHCTYSTLTDWLYEGREERLFQTSCPFSTPARQGWLLVQTEVPEGDCKTFFKFLLTQTLAGHHWRFAFWFSASFPWHLFWIPASRTQRQNQVSLAR